MSCAKIANNIVGVKCPNTAKPGVESELILINYADFEAAEKTIADGVITNLTLPTGVKGVKFTSAERGVDTEVTLAKGTYLSQWTHKVTARSFEKTQNIKEEIDILSNAKVVAIVCNKYAGNEGDTKYELFGCYSGLELAEATSTSTDADGIMYSLSMASNDAAKEPTLPLSVYKTSLEATKALIEALVA